MASRPSTPPTPEPRRRRTAGSRPANIHDVADKAGVSIKTVSRVLNREPNVREETRDKVLEAVSALSYRPNIFARALASEKSLLIGLVFDNPSASYAAGVQLGALARCREEGFHLIVETLEADAPDVDQRVLSLVRDSKLHGVILTPPLCDSPSVLATLSAEGTAFVRVAPGRNIPDTQQVSIDDVQAAIDITNHLIELGHRRIGFVRGHPAIGGAELRLQGFRTAMQKAGIPVDPKLVVQGYFSYQSGLEAANQLLSRDEPPTAIFASNDDMAAAVLATAYSFKLQTPYDLSVVGFDDSLIAQVVWPQLTTCRQPLYDMAAAAVSMLAAREAPDPLCRLQHKLIIRNSTAPPKQ